MKKISKTTHLHHFDEDNFKRHSLHCTCAVLTPSNNAQTADEIFSSARHRYVSLPAPAREQTRQIPSPILYGLMTTLRLDT
jgi:hypothetical protein